MDKAESSAAEAIPVAIAELQERLTAELGRSPDLVFRQLMLGPRPVLLVYLEGMADPHPLLQALHLDMELFLIQPKQGAEEIWKILKERSVALGKVNETASMDDLLQKLLSGNTVLAVDGLPSALTVGTEALKQRGVEEATSQSVVRGPREGFTESLRENTALVRRRIQNRKLRMEERQIGEETHTQVAVMFMEGICDEKVLEELRTRLDRIQLFVVPRHASRLPGHLRFAASARAYLSPGGDVYRGCLAHVH